MFGNFFSPAPFYAFFFNADGVVLGRNESFTLFKISILALLPGKTGLGAIVPIEFAVIIKGDCILMNEITA